MYLKFFFYVHAVEFSVHQNCYWYSYKYRLYAKVLCLCRRKKVIQVWNDLRAVADWPSGAPGVFPVGRCIMWASPFRNTCEYNVKNIATHLWCGVLPLCTKMSRATFWPQSAPAWRVNTRWHHFCFWVNYPFNSRTELHTYVYFSSHQHQMKTLGVHSM